MRNITKPGLRTKDAVIIPSPGYQDGTTIISTQTADMTNSETDLNQTASSENQSAKYKYPRVRQDIPKEGRGQYQAP